MCRGDLKIFSIRRVSGPSLMRDAVKNTAHPAILGWSDRHAFGGSEHGVALAQPRVLPACTCIAITSGTHGWD